MSEVHQFMSSDGGGGGGNNMGGPRPTQRPRPYDRYNNHYGNGERMRPPPLRGFRNSNAIFLYIFYFEYVLTMICLKISTKGEVIGAETLEVGSVHGDTVAAEVEEEAEIEEDPVDIAFT